MSVSVRGIVYSSVVVRLDDRDVVLQVEPIDPVLLALVEVDRAGVRDREHAGVVDRADGALVVDVEQPVLDRRTGTQPDSRRRARAAPTSTCGRRGA